MIVDKLLWRQLIAPPLMMETTGLTHGCPCPSGAGGL